MRLSSFGPALSALALLSPLAMELAAQRGRGATHPGFINEDLSRGLDTARRTGKPLMVVFRCPP